MVPPLEITWSSYKNKHSLFHHLNNNNMKKLSLKDLKDLKTVTLSTEKTKAVKGGGHIDLASQWPQG